MKKLLCALALLAIFLALPVSAQQLPWGGFGGAGGGTVTSVSLTGDNTIYATAISGSPVTGNGGFTLALKTACAFCLLNNATSSAAAPTYTTNPLVTSLALVADANGSRATQNSTTELLTLNTGATTTATVGNLAPANAKIIAILYRVTTTITTAINFNIKVTGGNVFASIGTATTSQTGMTANTTGVLVPVLHADQYNTSATTLTVTCNANPGAGAIRLTVVYESFIPPTS